MGGKDAKLIRLVRLGMLNRLRAAREAGRQPPEVCSAMIPEHTPSGTVTIYDSALLHYGTANSGKRPRVVLNANFAAGDAALWEENYEEHFSKPLPNWTEAMNSQRRVAFEELEWMRDIFNDSFYGSLLDGTACGAGGNNTVGVPEEVEQQRCFSWGQPEAEGPRRAALRQRLQDLLPPTAIAASVDSTDFWTCLAWCGRLAGLMMIFFLGRALKAGILWITGRRSSFA